MSMYPMIEDAQNELEERFWSIVDRDGLTGLPSDMFDALEMLVNRAAATQAVTDKQRAMAFEAGVERGRRIAESANCSPEPTEAMIDAGVAFALQVSLGGDYQWSQYVRDLFKNMAKAA